MLAPRRLAPLFALALLVLAWPAHVAAEKDKETKKAGGVLARTRSAAGTLWSMGKTLDLYSDLVPGAELLAPPGERGILEVKEGDLRVTLIGNLPGLSSSPVLETMVQLAAAKDADLDLTLKRGIVLLEAGKDADKVRARVHIQDKHIDVAIAKNGAVAFELFSHWPVGAAALKDAKAAPIGDLWLLVVRGKAEVTLDREKQSLTGPLAFHWTTRGGFEGPLALKSLPEWLTPEKIDGKEALAVMRANEKLRVLAAKDPSAWQTALKGKDDGLRRVAVFHAAARDKLEPVFETLNGDSATAVRRAAVQAVRRFAGRGVAERKTVVDRLAAAKYKAGQVDIFLHLLNGLSAEERSRPETYESLIGYLQNEKMGIRELAAERLVELAPAGKTIAYDAAASADARKMAQAAWRKLIPPGSLPKVEK